LRVRKSRVTLDWWSVILGAVAVLAVAAGLIKTVPW